MELKGCLSEAFKFHACPYFPQIDHPNLKGQLFI